MDRIRRTILLLDKRSEKERQGQVRVKPGQEMLAITADTGMFFYILAKAINARRILEVGTSVGFSTLWFALAVGKRGKIITIEQDSDKIGRAKKIFRRAGVEKLIEIKHGTAIDILHKLKGRFDFVLLDADKENVMAYFDLVLPLVRTGGIIVADNMIYPARYRKAMKNYALYVRSKSNVQSVTVPIGMGEEITIKLKDSIVSVPGN